MYEDKLEKDGLEQVVGKLLGIVLEEVGLRQGVLVDCVAEMVRAIVCEGGPKHAVEDVVGIIGEDMLGDVLGTQTLLVRAVRVLRTHDALEVVGVRAFALEC